MSKRLSDDILDIAKKLSRFAKVCLIMVLIWCFVTGGFYNPILESYYSGKLQNAFLEIDTIFFGAVIVLLAALINTKNPKYRGSIETLQSQSMAQALLILTNVSSYFISGWLDTIAIFYQVWTLPAFMWIFYFLVLPGIAVNQETILEKDTYS